MATLSNSALTLADWAKRIDPGGKTPKIVELLSQTNEILEDMLWQEGNLPIGNQTTQRTGLPIAYWKLVNGGVPTSKSTTVQVVDQGGVLQAWSEVDVTLAELNGNERAFRMSEAEAFVEAMNIEMAQTLFYGNQSLAPQEFTGLSVRYSAIAGAPNASHVISGGGAQSDNSSIWLIVWGKNKVTGFFPKGSKAGLSHIDYGKQVIDAAGTGFASDKMEVFQEKWEWKAGLAVEDWRYAVRVCNLDISNLVGNTTPADIIALMIKAWHRIPSFANGKAAWYMNRTIKEYLDLQERDDVQAGGSLTYDVVDGKPVSSFRGIPVRTCDALLETEATVS